MVTTEGRREVEVGTLLLSKDKNNVIARNVYISYFLCLSLSLKYRSHILGLNNNYYYPVRKCRFIEDICLYLF